MESFVGPPGEELMRADIRTAINETAHVGGAETIAEIARMHRLRDWPFHGQPLQVWQRIVREELNERGMLAIGEPYNAEHIEPAPAPLFTTAPAIGAKP